MSKFSNDEIQNKIAEISGWNFENGQIGKEFQLKDFAEALNFTNKVGGFAEEMNHHPDIFLHSWNKVKITVSTHSEGGITKKDFQLAEKINELL
jgi:4a-hydroxytetrahydrobiopterin dehydratase